jgi:hypothetical protein
MSNLRRIEYADTTMLSRPAIIRPRVRQFTKDQMMTYDAATQMTIDSTGAFLIGELERLDQTLHEPLVQVSWGRDIDLREDVTAADEFSSYTISTFAAPGGINPAGKNWIGKESTAISGISLDIGKVVNPLLLWGTELKWTLPELQSAEKTGRPVDQQKYAGMKLKYQMDIDQMVYVGDTDYNKTGMFNSALVTPYNVPLGTQGVTTWVTATGVITKSPDEIVADVNFLLTQAWTNAGYALIPTHLRLPPIHFSTLSSQKVSNAGNISIIEYIKKNSITNSSYGRELDIQPVKWLPGLGAGGTNRMVAYTKDKDRVRYPLVPLQRTPIQFRGLHQVVEYWGRLGVIELVYPETMQYADGI